MASPSSVASYLDKIPRVSRPAPESIFTSQWLKLKRGEIRYVRTGNPSAKDTVILMPDPPNTIEHMEELIKLLEPSFQVIAFEGMGFGYSKPALSYDFSIEHNADTIIELLNKLKISRAILALTCVAAIPGILVAQKHPEIITGLVLGQTPSLCEAKKWARRVDFKGALGTPFAGQIILKLMKKRVSDIWYKNALPVGENRQSYVQKAFKAFNKGAQFSLASAFQSLQQERIEPSSIIAQQDAIVLWGNLDRSHKKTNKHSVLELLPNGKLIELDHCAHFPDIEAPNEFAEAVFEVARTSG